MTSNVRKVIASVLIVLLLTLPGAVLAQEKRGANIVVTLKDGSAVSGELIAVKQNALVLMSPAGKDESIEIFRISTVTIVKKSKAGSGFLIGFLAGGIAGGVLGHLYSEGESQDEPKNTLAGAVLVGALAGLVGLGIGALAGGDKTIDFKGMTEAEVKLELNRLRGRARMRTAQ